MKKNLTLFYNINSDRCRIHISDSVGCSWEYDRKNYREFQVPDIVHGHCEWHMWVGKLTDYLSIVNKI